MAHSQRPNTCLLLQQGECSDQHRVLLAADQPGAEPGQLELPVLLRRHFRLGVSGGRPEELLGGLQGPRERKDNPFLREREFSHHHYLAPPPRLVQAQPLREARARPEGQAGSCWQP